MSFAFPYALSFKNEHFKLMNLSSTSSPITSLTHHLETKCTLEEHLSTGNVFLLHCDGLYVTGEFDPFKM